MVNERTYVCGVCRSVQRAPDGGGTVTCVQCRASTQLPDRAALPRFGQAPVADATRLASLRAQDGRMRQVPETVRSVLGGDRILPGREDEAFAYWQSLRVKAAGGDAAASEDLMIVAQLIVQQDAMTGRDDFVVALCESTLDAAVLPRHRQEQLGRLARRAIVAGDRARAVAFLAHMDPAPPDLESDSDFRLSAAVIAAFDRDGRRMIECLGPTRDSCPIADASDQLASVLRAHGHELAGNDAAAAQVLRELANPRILPMIQAGFPNLQLCARAGATYQSATTAEGAARAARSAGTIGRMLGFIFGSIGVIFLVVGAVIASTLPIAAGTGYLFVVLGGAMIAVAVFAFVRAGKAGARAAWLRTNGIPLRARCTHAQPTGMLINEIRVYELTLSIAGQHGPYNATMRETLLEHQVTQMLGAELMVRVDPQNPQAFVLEG